MFDRNIKAEGTLVADPERASSELPSFVADVRSRVTATTANVAAAAANSVQVTPGGRTFSTIGDALNSITDASRGKQYVVNVGPGTYNEVVKCKPWVFIVGAGQGQTVVTAPSGPEQWDKGTIRGCSNAAVQNMTIVSLGQSFGQWTTAVNCDAAQNFDIENCQIQALDTTGAGTNLVAVSIDYSSMGGGSQVNIAYCSIVADGGVQPMGLLTFSNGYVDVTDSKIMSQNSNTTWGAASNGNSVLTLYDCYVSGSMSLVIPDYVSKITARDCQLVGPYSDGVVIINDGSNR